MKIEPDSRFESDSPFSRFSIGPGLVSDPISTPAMPTTTSFKPSSTVSKSQSMVNTTSASFDSPSASKPSCEGLHASVAGAIAAAIFGYALCMIVTIFFLKRKYSRRKKGQPSGSPAFDLLNGQYLLIPHRPRLMAEIRFVSILQTICIMIDLVQCF